MNEHPNGAGTILPGAKAVNRKTTVRFRVAEKVADYRPLSQPDLDRAATPRRGRCGVKIVRPDTGQLWARLDLDPELAAGIQARATATGHTFEEALPALLRDFFARETAKRKGGA